ncbi:hypothetical protein D3C83_273380 [compost metagenome]
MLRRPTCSRDLVIPASVDREIDECGSVEIGPALSLNDDAVVEIDPVLCRDIGIFGV